MCSVVGCDSWRHNVQRFSLPEDPERRQEWVQFLFEVNGQRLKESSWTDITICSKHFTDDCFVTGTFQLTPGAVPSLCIKTEPEEPEQSPQHVEPTETTQIFPQCDQLEAYQSPVSCVEASLPSVDAPGTQAPSDVSDSLMSHCGEMIQNIENIEMIREKAALLRVKGKYIVNEHRLLQLFSSKCPFCTSAVKMEKVTHGVLIILNQQCIQCDYRKQWKNLANASVPKAAGDTEVTSEMASTYDSHSSLITTSGIVRATDEEGSNPMDETEESDDNHMDSDEDWIPSEESGELYNKSDEESASEHDDYPSLSLKPSHLCTDCGRFFHRRKPHTCEHKIKPYSCNVCGKRCVSETALSSHNRIHDENYEHRFKYCRAAFKKKVEKLAHEQAHQTQEKPYKCPDCSQTFTTYKKRKVHLKVHRGPKLLKCHVCGMDFNRRQALHRHSSVHTGAKPHNCSVCQRSFSQANHLKSHMRLHTGERPYKCQLCDKCFNHNVSLKNHVQHCHTASSGQKKGDTGSARGEMGADSGLDIIEEEQDQNDVAQKEKMRIPENKRRSTGRPMGRPKRSAAVGMKEQAPKF
ncbi:zinc finger protein 91-like [Archocentrus centrarchus]|uniref:zinc finger protein 91-like n=1 Tax=Archocentrus centrarchus TaxID=63155 RepID=UPI0011E9CFD2|nr:zinc finger protein 91-like [Archocentrus centrarchus]